MLLPLNILFLLVFISAVFSASFLHYSLPVGTVLDYVILLWIWYNVMYYRTYSHRARTKTLCVRRVSPRCWVRNVHRVHLDASLTRTPTRPLRLRPPASRRGVPPTGSARSPREPPPLLNRSRGLYCPYSMIFHSGWAASLGAKSPMIPPFLRYVLYGRTSLRKLLMT